MSTIFFIFVSVLFALNSTYAEMNDLKSVPDKKNQANELVMKGNQSFSAQRYDEAIELYKQAVALDPNSIDANYNLGVAYGRKGMIDEAIASYERVITINPGHAQAYNNLGTSYERKGVPDKAHASYEKAVEIDPNLAPAQYNLGKSYLAQGFKDKASDYLYKAGMLFHKNKNKEWTQKSYDLLKQTNDKEKEKELQILLQIDTMEYEKSKKGQ